MCSVSSSSSSSHAAARCTVGKVFVSHIVDYLRHTTSRSSEDSGLEELCNMLDPEHKDVSIDLDTYHAVMKEWIDDCRRYYSFLGPCKTRSKDELCEKYASEPFPHTQLCV